MKKHKEYTIRGDFVEYGEVYSRRKWANRDLEYARKHFPKDNFKIYSRKVSDWKEVR